MPAKNLDMYQRQSGKGKYIIYYVEGLDGEKKEYRRFEADSGVWLTDEDKMPINGFEFKNWYQEARGIRGIAVISGFITPESLIHFSLKTASQ